MYANPLVLGSQALKQPAEAMETVGSSSKAGTFLMQLADV